MKVVFFVKEGAEKLAEEVMNVLEIVYGGVVVVENTSEADYVFSVGGDGTMVHALKMSNGAPVVGVNGGTLGYLAEIEAKSLYSQLFHLYHDRHSVEKHHMLDCKVTRNGKVVFKSEAINDCIVSRSTAFDMIRFDLYIGSRFVKQYNADGFVVATPLGSTAYSLSCGGPIIEPTSKLIELTPIAPHSLMNRSIVVDDTKSVNLVVNDSRNNNQNTLLSLDGEAPFCLEVGDVVNIKKSKKVANIVRLKNDSFVEALAKKMNGN